MTHSYNTSIWLLILHDKRPITHSTVSGMDTDFASTSGTISKYYSLSILGAFCRQEIINKEENFY